MHGQTTLKFPRLSCLHDWALHQKQDMEIEVSLIGKSFNYPKGSSRRESHANFKIPYVYDFTTKLYRQQAEEVTWNMRIKMLATMDRAKAKTRNITALDLEAIKCAAFKVSKLTL